MRLFRYLGRFASVTAAAVLVGTSLTSAADLGGGSYKDPVYAPPVVESDIWTGFYVGGQVGLGVGRTSGNVKGIPNANGSIDTSGVNGGIYGGYNWQIGQTVLGIEGDYNWADVEGNRSCSGGFNFNCRSELDWSASIVGRAGYAVGRHMFYGKAGAVWADLNTTVSQPLVPGNFVDGGDTHFGWVVGIGYEFAFTRNFLMRIDYSHMDFGSERHFRAPFIGNPVDVDATFDTIKLGAAFKF